MDSIKKNDLIRSISEIPDEIDWENVGSCKPNPKNIEGAQRLVGLYVFDNYTDDITVFNGGISGEVVINIQKNNTYGTIIIDSNKAYCRSKNYYKCFSIKHLYNKIDKIKNFLNNI